MRIVAGAARGRRLVAPTGAAVRPTTDRVREALFSSLSGRVRGAHVLDLFAGTGALGLEALSRGAASVTLVEQDARAIAALTTNVRAVGLPGADVVAREVARWLAVTDPATRRFDVVLLDPPYAIDEEVLAHCLALLVPLLAPAAVVVVERSAQAPAPSWPAGLVADGTRRYGSTTLHRAHPARDDESDRARSTP